MVETKKQELVPQEFEKLPAEVRANMLSSEKSIFFNVALFEQAQRIATMFAESTMVPEHFRGNVGNCMIGINYAMRLQADPFMVMQCLYIIYGKPGIEGKLVEAVINQSAKYSEPLQYEWLDPEDKVVDRRTVLNHKDFGEYGCQAFSIDAKSRKRVDGPKISWKLIKAEGWFDRKDKKTGTLISKWRTMPEMMFYYRAASWFSNKNCPELKLGMHTTEELQDITDLSKQLNGSYAAPVSLNDKLKPSKPKPSATAHEDAGLAGEDPHETKESTKEEEKEEYETMNKLPFKKWCKKARNTISNMDARHQAKIYKRWQKDFPSEDFPVADKVEDPVVPPEENQGSSEHPTETEAMLALVDGAELTEDGIIVSCPDRGPEVQMLRSKCDGIGFDRCEKRDECLTWMPWDNRDKE